MTNETTLAFELPEARAAATSGNAPLDRIAVRDYTTEVEIGAFQAERGVTQRIRFNVVLEVSSSAAAKFDDVDQVLSYDTITEAIQDQLAFERLNLLETLAERIAEQVLVNPRAVRIFVRIEKLDRIPGSLGVEIVRTRGDGENLHPIDTPAAQEVSIVHPLVVFLPNTVLHGAGLPAWLDAIAAHELPAIICVEQALETAPQADVDAANNRIALLSIEQNAWVLAGKDKRCVVVDSRTEMDWAIKNGQLSVWAPSKMVLDAVRKPKVGADQPLALAQWFAAEFSADHVSVLQGFDGAIANERLQIVDTATDL
ncbi:hypothetical protein BFP76_04740 [Amylibacter kogurei]|uniref:dihydroneopterin aldolase n=1 Tax=Paramylibacter kogurei TaxID=1889778 RepID=A0A2G5K666_9RHOB|nr:dihydroneopterin aldolase [Amylibacter kogurei]PIB24512.1 hypothetical protein BFP76_04740 [Amylibacter kogurei]